MFNKIKAKIDKFIINFMYFATIFNYTNKAKYSDKSSEIMSNILKRSDKYIKEGEKNMDSIIRIKGDKTEKEYPLWIEFIDDSDFLFLGKCVRALYDIGTISPLVCRVDNKYDNELLGFLIIMPKSFCEYRELLNFVTYHEIGHIVNGDFTCGTICIDKLNTSTVKEYLADKAAKDTMNLLTTECMNLVYMSFENSYMTTIETIPTLSKRWNTVEKREKVVNNILKYDDVLHTRLNTLKFGPHI